MTQHHRNLAISLSGYRRKYVSKFKPAVLRLLLLFSVFFVVVTFIFVPRNLFPPCPSGSDDQKSYRKESNPCHEIANNTICCDRTSYRTDICFVHGNVQTHSQSNSLFLFSSETTEHEERIRPYTRKWENTTMATIHELRLRTSNQTKLCGVHHDVPAVVFSNGGFTGNVYHEFNDGLIPLYITSHQFNKKVVFVVVEYHDWWFTKYQDILSHLSDYPLIDFSKDKRTHCFPEAIVGLRIHDELTIDPNRMTTNITIRDFRKMLDEAYKPRIDFLLQQEQQPVGSRISGKPKLLIITREGSRRLENENEIVELTSEIGFEVETLKPEEGLELAKIYRALNSCDVMIGVHGAAMTHFLFMRPGSVFIQIIPLGTSWAADTYYGEPAMKLGLKYVRYKIGPKESSLSRKYREDDPVVANPESVNAKGWEMTKKVYLNGQNVILDLSRFRETLVQAYEHVVLEKKKKKTIN